MGSSPMARVVVKDILNPIVDYGMDLRAVPLCLPLTLAFSFLQSLLANSSKPGEYFEGEFRWYHL
jgi:hypothetical protein